QRAIEQNVLVATPTTLLTSLNIVRQLWRFEDQNRHTAELAERAAKVYDKLRTFLGSMDGIGKSLDKAGEAYRKACGQLVGGPGNLVKQVADFKELGVAVRTELDGQWTERAELELNVVELEDRS
ncbi:MAG TPA: DNA recombination protein RmuC, partial [Pseudomonas sp.]|nr:DNA recombination protein RmuC [Pseudomonas sp.]